MEKAGDRVGTETREIECSVRRKWVSWFKWFPDWVHISGGLLSEGVWNVTAGKKQGFVSGSFLIHLLCVHLRKSLKSDIQLVLGSFFFSFCQSVSTLCDQNKCVCQQSMLGLEVEVISLIGTLPCFLLLLSLCHLFPLMMLFSASPPSLFPLPCYYPT